MSGEASINMSVKELSVFKTKELMKSLSKDSFKKGDPAIKAALPPIISDT